MTGRTATYRAELLLFIIILFIWNDVRAFQALDVESVTITVSDLDEIIPFYTGVLPFREESRFTLDSSTAATLYGETMNGGEVHIARLKLGEEQVFLQQFEGITGREIPADSKSNDLWFRHIAIVVRDMDEAYSELLEHSVTHVSTFPQTLPETIPAAAGIRAFYFRDPDDHNLELIWFPEGKGNPKWNRNQNSLYLGIDHTAIAVSDTERQKNFYEGLLGLTRAGESENFGTEQEHLNQMFGARLAITGMTAGSGLGVEFLEYITPPGGRPYPKESKPSDLWHWHTTIIVDDIKKIYENAAGNYAIISNGIVNLESTPLSYSRGLLLRDADGHAVLVVEK